MIVGKQIPVYPIKSLVPSTRKESFSILQFEQSFSSAQGDVYSPHRHDLYEIFWITEGEGTLWIDSHAYSLSPPVLCLISPGQVHAWRMSGRGSGFVLYLTSGFFAESTENGADPLELSFLHAVNHGPIVAIPNPSIEELTWFCCKLEQEFIAGSADADAVLHAYLRLLLIEAQRAAAAMSPLPQQRQEPIPLLTKRFLDLVERNFLSVSSVVDYAMFLNVTTNRLTETIKRATGKTAGQIIRERLLLEAKRLLQYSSFSTSEIAYQLGFDDPSYFSRFFKKYTGSTPSSFRDSLVVGCGVSAAV